MASVSSTRAQDLVYTSNYVEGNMPIGDVKSWFQAQISVVSLGVIAEGGHFGLITRNHLSQQLIGQIQKPSFLKQPISDIMISSPLVVNAGQELDVVVMRLFTEKSRDEEFFHDILVKDGAKFVGLISVRDLLVNHFETLTHKLTAIDAQLQALAQKNKELFSNSFRVGHQEGLFKQILESVPIPVAQFGEDGKIVVCNPRFLELLEYTPKTLEPGTRFKELFDDQFSVLHQKAVHNWEKAIHEDVACYTQLTARNRSGDALPVNAYFELMPDGRNIAISLINPTQDKTTSISLASGKGEDTTPAHSGNKPMGKVTQAIRMKLSNENAIGLARTVATNLIDRDDSIERLMKKVEAIIKVTGQIEESDAATGPLPTTLASALTPSFPERPPLQGNLADFSVIDLCQILVQGTKTGHLRLEPRGGYPAGDIFFYCGSIVHAMTDTGQSGQAAIPELMRASNGAFEFNFDVASPVSTIEGDAMGILMDACRVADETVR